MKKYTENTIHTKKDLSRVLIKIREQGYAIDNEEYIVGVRCVAAPILNQKGDPVAAVSIAAPQNRLSLNRCREYGEYLRNVTLKISKLLGYSP